MKNLKFTRAAGAAPLLMRALRVACAAAVLLALHFGEARADCMDSCMSEHDCGSEYETGRLYNSGSNCRMYQNQCETECKKDEDAQDHEGGGPYGAIAYDKKTGAWGIADESQDKKSAEQSASDYCSASGAKCEVVDSFSNACAAVATGGNAIVTWATEEDPDLAQDAALKKCRRQASSCAVQAWHCYSQ